MMEYPGSQFFRVFIIDFLGKKLVAEGAIPSMAELPQLIEQMSQIGFVVVRVCCNQADQQTENRKQWTHFGADYSLEF